MRCVLNKLLLIGGGGFRHPKLFHYYFCVKFIWMSRLKVCEVYDTYALGYELRVQ